MADAHSPSHPDARRRSATRATTRVHRMPFGAELLGDGTARFRLWAPSAQQVELCLTGPHGEECRPMEAQSDGWYTVVRPALAGARYRYRVNGETTVPDPASRFQAEDVHGPSELIDPAEFKWTDAEWRGRPWEEVVLYELHVGTFSPEGTYAGVEKKLQYLRTLGVTAIELMPLADFPGKRNWGYDGVLPYAPDSQYGRPEDLKRLIDAAHRMDMMVFLDVVYNHFGPEGNYLSLYAAPFFTDRHQTPWGQAINFDGEGSRRVRDYYVHNALYWLEEYHFDGLRFDAVHAIRDDSVPDIVTEIGTVVRAGPGRARHVHLVLENDDNKARYLRRDPSGRALYDAQWNDDIHHAMHVLATGESGGYYADYADAPHKRLGRCLAEGFAFQGDPSRYRHGAPRGETSVDVAPTAFVSFIQNHDQIGNRAFGERIAQLAPPERVRALSAVFLLAPSPPMLFMGEEWGTQTPFPFFCDFKAELAKAVTEGRRKEFARFPEFSDPAARARIPDPNDPATFAKAKLDWPAAERSEGSAWLVWYREVLRVRRTEIVPRAKDLRPHSGHYTVLGEQGVHVEWTLADGGRLYLLANLSDAPLAAAAPPGRTIYQYIPPGTTPQSGQLAPWSVIWSVE
jgi:maltooligosyltrehalose trehalohydrolase